MSPEDTENALPVRAIDDSATFDPVTLARVARIMRPAVARALARRAAAASPPPREDTERAEAA